MVYICVQLIHIYNHVPTNSDGERFSAPFAVEAVAAGEHVDHFTRSFGARVDVDEEGGAEEGYGAAAFAQKRPGYIIVYMYELYIYTIIYLHLRRMERPGSELGLRISCRV